MVHKTGPFIADAAELKVFWVLYPQGTNSVILQTMTARSPEMLEQTHYTTWNIIFENKNG
jgi:hypothetical protein